MRCNQLWIVLYLSVLFGQWSEPIQLTSGYIDKNPQLRNAPNYMNYYTRQFFTFERKTPRSTIWVGELTNIDNITYSQLFPLSVEDTTQGFNPQIISDYCIWESIIDSKRVILKTYLRYFPGYYVVDTVEVDVSISPYTLTPIYGWGCDYDVQSIIYSTENGIWWQGLYWNPNPIVFTPATLHPGYGLFCIDPQGQADFQYIVYQQNDTVFTDLSDTYYPSSYNPKIHYTDLLMPVLTFEQIDSSGTHLYQVAVNEYENEVYWDSIIAVHPGIASQSDFFSTSYPLVIRQTLGIVHGFVQSEEGHSTIKAFFHGDSINVSDTVGVHVNPAIGSTYDALAWVVWETATDSSTELWARYYDDPNNGIGDNAIPHIFGLSQNYPNPFNPITTIRYELPEQTPVKLTVFDLTGREISVLVDGNQMPGVREVQFNAGELASGIYFYQLTVSNRQFTKKLIVLK